jgi:periplasmic protein TonB
MTAIRLPVSFSLAWLATVTLFWFLGATLTLGRTTGPELIRTIPNIDLRPVHVPEPLEHHLPPVKPPIVKHEPLPGLPSITVDPRPGGFFTGTGTSPIEGLDPFTVGGPGRLSPTDPGGGPAMGGPDRDALPQIRIEPDYPPLAKAHGIEGWISFRFTVTREGRVKDVEIIAADPPHVWDQATLRAVSNWRYQPKLENGQPVEQRGVTATYRFTLDRS